ncbi:MAG TPA: amidohydrolase family protein [Chitinophagaceae bacterium]|jgi:cytosine/adenosine deaminase-related metal-dependent hydrolase|nr:amidohydrolase family protein [Chitinophagaceae bacterium]
MQYRKIAGPLFDGAGIVPGQPVLVLDQTGRVEALIDRSEAGEEVETYEGLLVPGLINAHCHLELSHMKDLIPRGTGLVPFLQSVVRLRGQRAEEKEAAIRAAGQELYGAGVAGVADICNTADALQEKRGSPLRWHNLVEVLNFYDAGLQKSLAQYGAVQAQYRNAGLTAVLTPHAPYTVSEKTFAAINAATAGQVITVHNQETAAEDLLFREGKGAFLDLFAAFADGRSPFAVSGQSSLRTWLRHFTEGQTVLLVHNTFISEEDLHFASEHAARYGLKLVYCLCPNANLYIEEQLPPAALWYRSGMEVVLGTDSYSSNGQLSIAAEIATLRQGFPEIPLEYWLRAATGNGATALGWEGDLGFFRKGTRPGVLLLKETDFSVTRLV